MNTEFQNIRYIGTIIKTLYFYTYITLFAYQDSFSINLLSNQDFACQFTTLGIISLEKSDSANNDQFDGRSPFLVAIISDFYKSYLATELLYILCLDKSCVIVDCIFTQGTERTFSAWFVIVKIEEGCELFRFQYNKDSNLFQRKTIFKRTFLSRISEVFTYEKD